MTEDLNESRLTRRTALKRIGAGAAVVWAAPAIMSIKASASASEPPPPGCTGPVELVMYGASGWRYLEVPTNGGAGFEAPGFDDSGFATGTAAFGSGGFCTIQNDVHTAWGINDDLLLRRTVTVPTGATAVSVYVTIDNDFIAYWDGVGIGANTHEGCPTYDDFFMAAPITPGNHVLAIRGIDRGGLSFLDARVHVDCA